MVKEDIKRQYELDIEIYIKYHFEDLFEGRYEDLDKDKQDEFKDRTLSLAKGLIKDGVYSLAKEIEILDIPIPKERIPQLEEYIKKHKNNCSK